MNWGLAVALGLRVALLLTATWVIQFWQFQLVGALYLLWLVGHHYAAYLTIFSVGLKLLCKAIQPELVPPDWTVLAMVVILFTWGFSKRSVELISEDAIGVVPEQVHLD
jgi:predicted tellurium resistance membrane protein TerC